MTKKIQETVKETVKTYTQTEVMKYAKEQGISYVNAKKKLFKSTKKN